MADGHLLINGSFLDQATTGSGQYIRSLLPRIARLWDGPVTALLPSGGTRDAGRSPSGVTLVTAPPPLRGNLGKAWFEHVTVPQAARRLKADVLFIPYFGPPLDQPVPTAVTVHDVIMLALPEYAGGLLAQWYTSFAAEGARRAARVLTDSEHSRRDAERLARIPAEWITVVPLATDLTAPPGGEVEITAGLREVFGLDPGYIYYVGGLDRRKDVGTLLRAYGTMDDPPPLVIAGEPRSTSTARFPDLRSIAAELRHADRVRFLGWVAEEHKPLIYAGAGVFAFPSIYEGFGLTPLEAMACGAPVVCSDASSLPEVVGDGGLLFPAGNAAALAAALQRVLRDGTLSALLREAGRRQAARFSWDATAAATVKALRAAAVSRKRVSQAARWS